MADSFFSSPANAQPFRPLQPDTFIVAKACINVRLTNTPRTILCVGVALKGDVFYNPHMEQDIERILISSDRLARRVHELADQIVISYGHLESHLTIVPILHGAIVFLADLIRHMPLKMDIALVTVSSYPGKTTQSKQAHIMGQLSCDITDRNVLIIDDILDTGKTLRLVRSELEKKHPKSVKTAVLLRKPTKAPRDLAVDFVGFDIKDNFVVGYGLDYNDYYRNLPYLAVLHPRAM